MAHLLQRLSAAAPAYTGVALQYLGAATAAYLALRAALNFKRVFLSSGGAALSRILKKGGAWAVVTGASEGIGRALAVELARRGFNVILLARTVSKLEEVAAEIKSTRAGAQTKVLPFDFAKAGDAEYKALFTQLDAYEIGVLVNNVGLCYAYPQSYETPDIAEDLQMLKVNCESQLRMIKYIVGKMKAKKSGAILSLGSYMASFPFPLLATYSATKAFNAGFSDALAIELAEYGIDVLTVTPGLVISRMSTGGTGADAATVKATFDRVEATPMARITIGKIGNVTRTAGHTNHEINEIISHLLPRSIMNSKFLAMMKGANAETLKREAAAAKNQ